jgi:hypothetical protein
MGWRRSLFLEEVAVQRQLPSPSFIHLGCLLGLTLFAGGCERSQPTPATPATPANAPASEVTIRAKNFAFDAPAEITGGTVTFHFFNDGPDLHHVQLIRLADSKTVADLLQAMKAPGPLPAWATEAGGPNAVDPGHELTATMDVTPGDYALVCFVDTPDHVPHLFKGMAQPLKVLPAPAGASPPPAQPADLTITLSNFKFDLSDSITAGSKSIDVVVGPGQPHELVIFRLLPGKTVEDFMAWGASYKGPIPANVVGGTTAAVTGIPQRITVDFTPGQYLLICFVPDAADGKPHMMKGMVRAFAVS